MNPDKPGWQTTEFWTAIGLNIVAILKTVGWLPVQDVASVEGWWKEIVATAGLLISGLVAAVVYIRGRIEVKKARMVTAAAKRDAVTAEARVEA